MSDYNNCPRCGRFGSSTLNNPLVKYCSYCGKNFYIEESFDDVHKEGVKFDGDKPRTDLIPVEPILKIAEVFGFGAKKYSPNNYRRGMEHYRYYAALLRHMFAYWSGEDKDPESGLDHLAHAGCCLLMLYSNILDKVGKDDRWKKSEQQE